jgi:alpha-L-fucosidase 2
MRNLFRKLHIFIICATLAVLVPSCSAALPASFPASGKAIWFRTPGVSWTTDYLPIGNGFLAGGCMNLFYLHLLTLVSLAMVQGETVYDQITLNIEDLWSGGPFQSNACP